MGNSKFNQRGKVLAGLKILAQKAVTPQDFEAVYLLQTFICDNTKPEAAVLLPRMGKRNVDEGEYCSRHYQPQEVLDRLWKRIEELEAEREQCRQRMLKMVE